MPIAFREWAVTVRALAEGEQLVTLRKGVLPQTLPSDVHARLLKAVERKCTEKKLRAGLPSVQP